MGSPKHFAAFDVFHRQPNAFLRAEISELRAPVGGDDSLKHSGRTPYFRALLDAREFGDDAESPRGVVLDRARQIDARCLA